MALCQGIEIAEAMENDVEELDSVLRQASTSSLDAQVMEIRSLGDLIADSNKKNLRL